MQYGYEGLTFAIIAERLDVSRGALYKYYENKEELVTEYMIYEMSHFLIDLKKIQEYKDFHSKMDFLFKVIFKDHTIPQLIEMGMQIPISNNEKVKHNKEKLSNLRLDMYQHLQDFIKQGKKEMIVKPHMPEGLLLGIIFQSISIPNHFGIPREEWIKSIKEIITTGMFLKS